MSLNNHQTLARYPIMAVFLSMVGFIIIKTGRDAVFFQDNGLSQLPLAYISIAIAASMAAAIHLAAINRWGIRTTRTGIFFFTAVLFLGIAPLVDATNRMVMMVFFVITPVIFAGIFASAWLLAGDLLDGADQETKRWAYSRIGAGSMVGGIIGGLAARGLSIWFPPSVLIATGACVLILVGFLILSIHRAIPETEDAMDKNASDKTSMFRVFTQHADLVKQPYIKTMAGISALGAISALLIDFQFYATATISGNNSARFFADFYILLNLASLVLQLTLAPRLQAKLGVGGVLMLLPLALLGNVAIASWWATVGTKATLRITEGGVKASIHRAIWEQAFLPIDRVNRAVAKVFVDGLFARLSEGFGALGLYIWIVWVSSPLSFSDLQWLTWILLGCLLLWIRLTRQLKTLGCSNVTSVETDLRLPDT